MKKNILLSLYVLCLFMISCVSSLNIRKNELIRLNPSLFHKEDKIKYIGKIDLSLNRSIEIYFMEYLFGNRRANYKIVFFDSNNRVSFYTIEDEPTLIDNTLMFAYKKELGNKIEIKDRIPDNVYLNGEVIYLTVIK